MTEPSKADLLRRDLKHASDRRERAGELERFAKWMGLCYRDAKPLVFKVPEKGSGFYISLEAKQIELSEYQTSALQQFLNAEAARLRKHADSIEENLKI